MSEPLSARDRHLFGAGPKRILAVDGGGVRGIVSLAFLERIEALVQERCGDRNLRLCDYFDLVGGTSTGSIIATGLALGYSAKELVEMYLTLSRQGFQRRWWLGGLLVPKFKTAPLIAAIRSRVGDETLGSLRLRCGLGIVAKRLDTGSMWLFHNNPRGVYFSPTEENPAFTPNRDLPLSQLIRASSAAPSYFEPEMIEIARGVKGAFVDGALTPHLNPALLMVMLATLHGYGFRWPMGADRLMVVSIGTGGADEAPGAKSVAKMPAAWLAVTSLRSLMRDCDTLVQTVMQWMGESPTLWPIDSEIGDLAQDRLGPAKLFHYLRYDAKFEAKWLEAATGLRLSQAQIKELDTFDEPDLVPRLLEVGRLVAEKRVDAAHFPQLFDISPTIATRTA
jgi:uncharacterized protein